MTDPAMPALSYAWESRDQTGRFRDKLLGGKRASLNCAVSLRQSDYSPQTPFDLKILQNLDREQPAPNALVVDDNNRPRKILRGNGHQYAPDAFQAIGFAVVAAPEQD